MRHLSKRSAMRVVTALGMVASVVVGVAGPAPGQTPAEDRARGMVFDGLKRSPADGPCPGMFVLAAEAAVTNAKVPCSHGPDPAPEGVDVRRRREPEPQLPAALTGPQGGPAGASSGIPCYGDGTDGYRVHVIYARSSDVPDRYADYAASFVQWVATVDRQISDSAQDTGGYRRVRFVTDANCDLVVSRVELTPTGDDTFAKMVAELGGKGFNRTDRKYLVYADSNVYCGLGEKYGDDSYNAAPRSNDNNGGGSRGTVAAVGTGCWGRAEGHELMHSLGGVQSSAPHATPGGHCTDDEDILCYKDGDSVVMSKVCTTGPELFDCNHDDYFSTDPAPSNYLASHWNTASSAFLARNPPGTDPGGRYNPLNPARILDTRNGAGGISQPVGPGSTVDVQITGQGGVPASGVAAVAMNVTVTGPTAAGFLTLHPSGSARPLAANLNFVAGQTVPNMVVAKVGAGGKVSLYNSAGNSHVIFDVAGWYSDVPGGNDGRYQPLQPARLLDTRDGTGGGTRLGPGSSLDMKVTERGGVPAEGVAAVVLNVAATAPTSTSFLTLYPTGMGKPTTANLNFGAKDTVSNRVIATVGMEGKVTIFNNSGSTDVIVDVNGWYTDGYANGLSGVSNTVVPARILDTRDGAGGVSGLRAAGSTVDVQITGRGGVPTSGVSAVILNVTVTSPGATGFLTLFPTGTTKPLASDLNYAGGQTRPNLVVVKVGAGGKVGLYTSAGAHVIFDVAGWVAS